MVLRMKFGGKIATFAKLQNGFW